LFVKNVFLALHFSALFFGASGGGQLGAARDKPLQRAVCDICSAKL
jgi:hypothetical protein